MLIDDLISNRNEIMEKLKKIDDTKSKIDDTKSKIIKNPRSITSYAAKSIYYFPVLCSKTVSGKTAFMLSNSLEAAYSSFVTACFAMIPGITVTGNIIDVEEYLRLFHQNMGINSNGDISFSLREAAKPYDLFVNTVLNESVRNDNQNNTNDQKNKNKIPDYQKNAELAVDLEQQNEKHNKLKPSIVTVTCNFIINNNVVPVKIPVGIKTVMHTVNISELRDHIIDSMANKGVLHNLIRYTTGEVLSLGDILFGISKMKKNIVNSKTSEVARWIDSIEHRKRLNRFSRAALVKKPYLPNVSLLVSMDDINDIDHLIGYNLLKDTYRAVKFIKDNFLLSFIIADDISETAYILYDGHSTYEEYPYTALKRENERNADAVAALARSLGIK